MQTWLFLIIAAASGFDTAAKPEALTMKKPEQKPFVKASEKAVQKAPQEPQKAPQTASGFDLDDLLNL